jgi:hypothetical protein
LLLDSSSTWWNSWIYILDVCGVITVPGQNLVDLYSNWVVGIAGASSIDEATGVITIDYAIESPQGTPDRLYHKPLLNNSLIINN